MPRGSNTRTRIIELARSHLERLGFHGFSYRTLANVLKVKSAAVHYHFPSKADLGTALVDHLRREFQKWAVEVDGSRSSAALRLDAFFELHRGFVDRNILSSFGVLEAEYSTLPERMQAEVRILAAEIHGWIARTLRQAAAEGSLAFSGDPDDQALVVGATVQGAMRIAQVFGPERYQQAIAQLKLLMTAGG